jgi:signal transduction histidine kinase
LADAGRLLAHSLDPEATLSALAMLTVPALADCCIIDLKNRDESTRYVKVFHNALNESQLASALDNLPHSKLLRVQRAVQEGRALLEERIAPVKLLQVAEKTQNLTVFDEYPHAMCSIVPLVARGEVLGVLCFVNLTAPLDQDLAEKLAILAAMAVENARLHTAAVAAIQARNHVLSVVAHDLRNPLTAISLLAQQLLRKNTSADLERRVGTAAKTVINCVKVAETLIQNLLDVARIDSDHLYLERKPVRAAALIDDVLRLMTPSAEFKGVTLLGPLSALASMIEVDPERMVQLFSNILGNAIKFTEPDGQITIDAARQGTEVLFSVADTGCGIASDDVPHLFNRFWQARANDRGGAGLGMSIAKGITEAHGGRIWVKSTVGVGTTIFFTAPLCKTLTAAEN